MVGRIDGVEDVPFAQRGAYGNLHRFAHFGRDLGTGKPYFGKAGRLFVFLAVQYKVTLRPDNPFRLVVAECHDAIGARSPFREVGVEGVAVGTDGHLAHLHLDFEAVERFPFDVVERVEYEPAGPLDGLPVEGTHLSLDLPGRLELVEVSGGGDGDEVGRVAYLHGGRLLYRLAGGGGDGRFDAVYIGLLLVDERLGADALRRESDGKIARGVDRGGAALNLFAAGGKEVPEEGVGLAVDGVSHRGPGLRYAAVAAGRALQGDGLAEAGALGHRLELDAEHGQFVFGYRYREPVAPRLVHAQGIVAQQIAARNDKRAGELAVGIGDNLGRGYLARRGVEQRYGAVLAAYGAVFVGRVDVADAREVERLSRPVERAVGEECGAGIAVVAVVVAAWQ